MKIVIDLADGAEEAVEELLRWHQERRYSSSGAVVAIGEPATDTTAFRWRVTGIEVARDRAGED